MCARHGGASLSAAWGTRFSQNLLLEERILVGQLCYVAAGKRLSLPREAAQSREPVPRPLHLCPSWGAAAAVPAGGRCAYPAWLQGRALGWCLQIGCDRSLTARKAAMPQTRALLSPTQGAGGGPFTGSLLRCPTICPSHHRAASPSNIYRQDGAIRRCRAWKNGGKPCGCAQRTGPNPQGPGRCFLSVCLQLSHLCLVDIGPQ